MADAVEFRGCDNLVFAEITADSSTAYTAGTVKVLAPVAEVSKTISSNSETHYYDNVGMITIRAEGTDEVTLTVPVLDLETLATLTGKVVDTATGAFLDGAHKIFTESLENTEKQVSLSEIKLQKWKVAPIM